MSMRVPETTISPEPEEKLRDHQSPFSAAHHPPVGAASWRLGAEPQLSWITPEPQVQQLGGVRAE